MKIINAKVYTEAGIFEEKDVCRTGASTSCYQSCCHCCCQYYAHYFLFHVFFLHYSKNSGLFRWLETVALRFYYTKKPSQAFSA